MKNTNYCQLWRKFDGRQVRLRKRFRKRIARLIGITNIQAILRG